MPNTLSNFLIGIGLDFDDKGAKRATSSIDSIKRTALQAGSAVAAAFGAKAITTDVANRTNMYRQQAEVIGANVRKLDALTRVYEREGGNAQSLFGQLEAIKKLRAGLITGNTSWIPKGALAGLDTNAIINSADPVEAYQKIIAQMSKMSVEQRLNVANALGLDDISINLAIKRVDYLQRQMARAIERRPLATALQKESEEYSKNWSDLWDNIEGLTDRAAAKIIPKVNEISSSLNSWFDGNRNLINEGVDKTFGFIADNITSIAVAAGSLTSSAVGSSLSSMAKYLPIIGATAGRLGMVAKSLGSIGLAYAAADITASAIDKVGRKFEWYRKSDAAFTKWIYDKTGYDLTSNDYFKNGGTLQGDDTPAASSPSTPSSPQPTLSGDDDSAAISPPAPLSPPPVLSGGVRPDQSRMPTVVTPRDVAKADKVVAQKQSYVNMFTEQRAMRSQSSERPIYLNATIQIGNKTIRDAVIEVNEEQDRQTIKDFKSPVDR